MSIPLYPPTTPEGEWQAEIILMNLLGLQEQQFRAWEGPDKAEWMDRAKRAIYALHVDGGMTWKS